MTRGVLAGTRSRALIIGTAGHIDHGKTSLVEALTGVNADRLPEEKKRGITIDLGFADLNLNGLRIAFIDVPGHEKFIRNMLAGAHGIDAVLLVVAADEGVMPQTREHFDICRLLGLSTGLIVITKTDMADPDLKSVVISEVEELVAGSFLEGAPIISTSAHTGEGIENLKHNLESLSERIPARNSDTVLRLPIDRSFQIHGFGTVVTGTLISGEVEEGQELALFPQLKAVRVRGIQVHGETVSKALAGQRTALNLSGIDSSEIERGMVLAPLGLLEPTQILDTQVDLLRSSKSLKSRARIRLHIGTAELTGRVQLLDCEEIEPGSTGLVQIRLESPVVALPHDRFILRSYSPANTIGGGIVIDPIARKLKARERAAYVERIRRRESDPVSEILFILEKFGQKGATLAQIRSNTGWTETFLKRVLEMAEKSGQVVDAHGIFIQRGDLDSLTQKLVNDIKDHHRRDPLSRGANRETLREKLFSQLPLELFKFVLEEAEKSKQIITERELVRSYAYSAQLSGSDEALSRRLESFYKEAGLEPPTTNELFERLKITEKDRARKLLQLLVKDKKLFKTGDLYFHTDSIDELKSRLSLFAQTSSDRTIDVSTFKTLTGTSRKYAIPLLELFDSERLTVRSGDRRLLL
jgi:selenocysteine-specific elongation factor